MVKRLFVIFAAILAIGLTGSAYGQSCPPGSYPVGGGGSFGCAPISGSWEGDGRGGESPSRRGYWLDKHTTIVWGYATAASAWQYAWGDSDTPQSAYERAMTSCREQELLNCVHSMSVGNAFIAVAREQDGNLLSASGKSVKAAQRNVMGKCKKAKSTCTIVATHGGMGRFIPI